MAFDPNTTQYMTYLTDALWWLGIAFWTLLGVGVVFFFYYWITFAIPIHVYEIIGSEKVPRFIRRTKGKITNKDGVTKLKISGIKGDFPPPKSTDYQLGRKGKLLNLIKEANEFKPFQISANPGHMVIQDFDIRFWTAQSMGEQTKKYIEPSFMQKYGAYMVFIFGLLVLGWMFFIMIETIGADVDKNLAIAQTVADAMKSQVAGP